MNIAPAKFSARSGCATPAYLPAAKPPPAHRAHDAETPRGVVHDPDLARMGGVAGTQAFYHGGDIARFARMMLAGGARRRTFSSRRR
jgi:hypothetical protein